MGRPSRQSLLPYFLYLPSSPTAADLSLIAFLRGSVPFSPPSPSSNGGPRESFAIPAPAGEKIELYSAQYYAACTAGGIASCGLTHMAVTPLDLVKCNMQIDPSKYKSVVSGFRVLLKEQGLRGFFGGWLPTLLGYSAQGACKFGFYEFFKKFYSDIFGSESAAKHKTIICLAGSASAEIIADIALCPMEAIKVRVQTQPDFARDCTKDFFRFGGVRYPELHEDNVIRQSFKLCLTDGIY